jgi:hypothetical protein
VAIPGPRGGFFTVYILSPIIGALFGAGVYELLVRRYLPGPGVEMEVGVEEVLDRA